MQMQITPVMHGQNCSKASTNTNKGEPETPAPPISSRRTIKMNNAEENANAARQRAALERALNSPSQIEIDDEDLFASDFASDSTVAERDTRSFLIHDHIALLTATIKNWKRPLDDAEIISALSRWTEGFKRKSFEKTSEADKRIAVELGAAIQSVIDEEDIKS